MIVNQRESLSPNEILWELIREEDIAFLNKSLGHPEVIDFCYWMEENLLSSLFPEFSCRKFIEDIQSRRKCLNVRQIHTKSPETLNAFLEIVFRILGEKKEKFLISFIESMYTRDVLDFYRRMCEIISPVIEVDIISIARTLDNEGFTQGPLALAAQSLSQIASSAEDLTKWGVIIGDEFNYWIEKYVTTWHQNMSEGDGLSIRGVPLGPISEYVIMPEIVGMKSSSQTNLKKNNDTTL